MYYLEFIIKHTIVFFGVSAVVTRSHQREFGEHLIQLNRVTYLKSFNVKRIYWYGQYIGNELVCESQRDS